MNPWLDGLSALDHYAWTIFSILLMFVWGQIVVVKIFKGRFTDAETLSLSMAGWVIPVMLWAGLYLGGVFLFGQTAGKVLAVIVLLIPILAPPFRIGRVSLSAFALALFFSVSVILRFAFLQKAILPSYFDSAMHYRIIQYFLGTWLSGAAPQGWVAPNYYHAGYHVLSAALSHFFQLGIVDVMLVFGQVALAALPLSLFFIVRRETQSDAAALFSVLLAGFGFHMPAHSINWGKYPALFSMISVQFVLGMAYLAYRNDRLKIRASKMYGLIGIGVLISALLHTRTLVVLIFGAMAMGFAWGCKRLPAAFQHLLFGFVICAIAVEIYFMRENAALAPLLDGYLKKDVWMLALLFLLTPFAMKFHPDLAFFLLASSSLFISGLFIPVQLPAFGSLTLLDRPYVQALLSLPLALMGGLGLAGLTQWTRRLLPDPGLPARLTPILAFGLVLLNGTLRHDFYPSDCCQFASRDDLAAIAWMDKSLPTDSKILIASAELYVTSLEDLDIRTSVDGGVWIAPMISRQTIPAWQGLDFTQPEIHTEICEKDLEYVYIGGMPQSFDARQLEARPAWYREAFALPNARVVRVIGCR